MIKYRVSPANVLQVRFYKSLFCIHSSYKTLKLHVNFFSVNCANVSIGHIAYCQCYPCGENDGDCDSDDDCMGNSTCGTNNCPIDLGFESNVDCCYTSMPGDENFCTVKSPCKENEGDCDSHDECDGPYLICGNCSAEFGFDNETDCCIAGSIGHEYYCTTDNPCGQHEGDCDSHDECQDGLVCGSNNCPASLSFDSEVDCCYHPNLGHEHFCASGIPCNEDEGDCDSNEECQTGLGCGSNNCPASLGFDPGVDCCYPCSGTCVDHSFKGDNYCDDENNNCGCEWDGGDCCGSNVNTEYCSACECLSTTSASTETTSAWTLVLALKTRRWSGRANLRQ